MSSSAFAFDDARNNPQSLSTSVLYAEMSRSAPARRRSKHIHDGCSPHHTRDRAHPHRESGRCVRPPPTRRPARMWTPSPHRLHGCHRCVPIPSSRRGTRYSGTRFPSRCLTRPGQGTSQTGLPLRGRQTRATPRAPR